MEEKDVEMDCSNIPDSKFSKKFRALLSMAIIYTGALTLVAILKINVLFSENILWQGIDGKSYNSILWEDMIYLIMIFCFIFLIKISVSKKPFSGVLVNCIYAIATLLVVGAVVFPLLPLYELPGFIMGVEGKPYIDGLPFVVGILLLIFAKIVQYGFVYQKEMDTIV